VATEQGVVLKVGADTAWVKASKSTACEGCASKGSCTAMGEDMEVEALNIVGAKQGDRIVLTFETSPLLKASFFLYVFPILCMVAGAITGMHIAPKLDLDPSGSSAVSGFLFFFIAAFIVKIKGNQMSAKAKYRPKITRIIHPRLNR